MLKRQCEILKAQLDDSNFVFEQKYCSSNGSSNRRNQANLQLITIPHNPQLLKNNIVKRGLERNGLEQALRDPHRPTINKILEKSLASCSLHQGTY